MCGSCVSVVGRVLHRRRKLGRVPASTVAGALTFVAGWWMLSLWLGNTRLPSPWSTLQAFALGFTESSALRAYGAGTQGAFLPHIWYSARVAAVGTTLGVCVGIGLALIMAWTPQVRLFLSPGIEIIRTIPPLAAAPFFLMWFGPGLWTQLGVIVFFASLRLVIFALEAIRNVPPVYSQYALTMGANRHQLFKTVIIPAIVPELTGAVRVTIATAWGLQVVAELLGSTMGIGKLFSILSMLLATPAIMGLVLWLSAIAILVDISFTRIARRATRWAPE